ncbi:hypothetical protein [uncultured Methylobacterium sp.]|uniref:hypothetical protein n=1 Tax=uncultured Methylobacterium sp. TaxID=157278 RepID=UPI0035CBF302
MTTSIDSAGDASPASPQALLKAAVSGGRAPEAASAPAKATTAIAKARRRLDPPMIGLAGAGLLVGTLLGAGTAILAAPRPDGTGAALAEVQAGLEASRLEASGLNRASDRLATSIAAVKEAADAARGEATARGIALTQTVGKVETALATKIAALAERIDQAEKAQGARIASLAAPSEKRPVAAPAPVAKAEPVQTGSLADTKPKPSAAETPAVIEGWAVRDVYDGTAMLEDRRRRLVEVAAGASIPGVGRVEAVERRGRAWVVVTRQGIITPQPW